jgi:uncharacterized Zn-binding protein involved in type VI secretion
MPLPLILAGQSTTDVAGALGTVVGPVGMVYAMPGTTVVAGKKRLPVATIGQPIAEHGNPFNPNAPGYQPLCADAEIDGPPATASTVMVNGRMIAPTTSVCTCTHYVLFDVEPTVLVGK